MAVTKQNVLAPGLIDEKYSILREEAAGTSHSPLHRLAKTRSYFKLAKQRGYSPGCLLEGTGLPPGIENEPDRMIKVDQYYRIVDNLLTLIPESGLGLKAGLNFAFSDMGILGYAMKSARCIKDTAVIWVRYCDSLYGAPLRFTLKENEGGAWTLKMRSHAPHLQMRQFFIEEFLMIGLRLLQMVCEETPVFDRIRFAFHPPEDLSVYSRHFGDCLEFNALEAEVTMSSPRMDSPIRTHDQELNDACSFQCQQILQQLSSNDGVEGRLRGLLINSPSNLPDFTGAARELGTSTRTLSRRLQGSGFQYRQLKSDYRRDLALQYLDSGRLSVKEFSYLLDYTSPSAFCRAFKRWLGMTPGQYLASKAAAPDASVGGEHLVGHAEN